MRKQTIQVQICIVKCVSMCEKCNLPFWVHVGFSQNKWNARKLTALHVAALA